jgi:hypothetical protein
MKRATLLLVTLLFPLVLLGQESSAQPQQNAKDKTTIVFFREHRSTGGWRLKPPIYVDDKKIMRLPGGRWFSLDLEPGKHKIRSSNKNELSTVVEVAPGKTICVEMSVVMIGWAQADVRFIEVDSKEAQDKIAKLKPVSEREGDKP